jgi:hypothetical protein
VELLVDYLILVLPANNDDLITHHTLAAREHILLHMYHYVHHLAYLRHCHIHLVVELNLQELGKNHLRLAVVFEEEHHN